MADLTPEDIAIMKQAIAEYEGANGMSANPDEAADVAGDAAQDRQMLQAIVAALETIIDEVETLKKCHEELEHKVNDEIIGGITKLYNENVRMDGISSVKSRYGEQFKPYEGVFQALVDDPNADIYANLYEKLEEMKSGEGYNEEAESGYVTSLLDKLKASAPAPAIAVEISEEPASKEEAYLQKLRELKSQGRLGSR